MFEYIRTHKRIMQGVLLVIIFPSFALFGVDSFLRSRDANTSVATVAGQAVSQQEFDQALRNQLDRLKQAYGPDFDAQMLNTPEARKGILDDLIARKALIVEAAKTKLTVTDQALQANILETPGLKKPDNSFDTERYKSLLAMQNMTPAMYESSLRQDLVLQQLIGSIQNTAISPKTVAERIASISEQERDVQLLNFKAKDFASEVKVSEQMMRAYYDKNPKQFEIPEIVNAEYVVLSNDALAAQIVVSDAEVAGHYEQNKTNYTTDELRRASHILLNLKKDAPESEARAVKAKAEALLAQVRKDPTQFAKLAKENSQDPGSAERGGDLDFFARGSMEKNFDEAAFKLKEGEISSLVQTAYGIHIIQLTSIKPKAVKPLEEVKAQLVADIKKQKASKAYAEAAEVFTNTVYEQSDSLQAVADKLKLKIEKVSNLNRQPIPGMPATMIANNTKFLTAIFSEDALKKKNNIEAIEIAPNTLLSGRVVEYKPASKRPFDEVKAVIQARVTETEALALAKKTGEAKLQALKTADNAAGFSEVKTVSRLKKADFSNESLLAIVKADVQKLPAFVGIDVPGIGYEIYRISKVASGTPDSARRASEAQQLENATAQQDVYSYIEALKKKAKVEINSAALNRKAGTNAP
ncbi:SurA N-terminal domain-containing protein [Undibacterium fentianense]|uniref:Periplasmic chaperone PpiD n=1 Tax=Undibacterium fentianense TaxID=2828728 RepID=A0A941ICG9_9BURK|nr:SurA N-terminal domain-containing protein [Undibacterium fentianense]MBR7798858.1 SurA N-terminal domain-containing protein [Undibacterium fentianense]